MTLDSHGGVDTGAAHFFDLRGPSHYSGNYLIGFEHCGAHLFDLGGHSQFPLLSTQVITT